MPVRIIQDRRLGAVVEVERLNDIEVGLDFNSDSSVPTGLAVAFQFNPRFLGALFFPLWNGCEYRVEEMRSRYLFPEINDQ
jgi:hypothetical protein